MAFGTRGLPNGAPGGEPLENPGEKRKLSARGSVRQRRGKCSPLVPFPGEEACARDLADLKRAARNEAQELRPEKPKLAIRHVFLMVGKWSPYRAAVDGITCPHRTAPLAPDVPPWQHRARQIRQAARRGALLKSRVRVLQRAVTEPLWVRWSCVLSEAPAAVRLPARQLPRCFPGSPRQSRRQRYPAL